MASLTFLNNKNFTLMSDSLVYEQDELNTLTGILDQANKVHQLLENEEKDIETSRERGFNEGYENGQTAGYEAALEHIAVKLVTLAKQANETRGELQESAGEIALQIVEKIASDIGPKDTVRSLALSAATQLAPYESVVLKVNPANREFLEENLLAENNPNQKIVEVVSDPALDEQDCILETEYGHIKAGLQTQINVMRSKFYDR